MAVVVYKKIVHNFRPFLFDFIFSKILRDWGPTLIIYFKFEFSFDLTPTLSLTKTQICILLPFSLTQMLRTKQCKGLQPIDFCNKLNWFRLLTLLSRLPWKLWQRYLHQYVFGMHLYRLSPNPSTNLFVGANASVALNHALSYFAIIYKLTLNKNKNSQ